MNRENRKIKMFEGNGSPMLAKKVLRNDRCGCGSGKKAKKCCGCDTKYFDSKPNFHAKKKED